MANKYCESCKEEIQHGRAVGTMHEKNQADRPSVLYRPKLEKDGVLWWARYGDVLALGGSPERAMEHFDILWLEVIPVPDKTEEVVAS